MSVSEFSRRYIAMGLTEAMQYNSEQRHFEEYRRIEQLLCRCVREGDLNGLEELYRYEGIRTEGLYSGSVIGKERTMFIVTVCLVSRSAVDGGLPVEISYPLSDIYLLRMESLGSTEQIHNFLHNCILDYTSRVHEYRAMQQKNSKYSPLVRRAQGLVLARIGTQLTITSIAEELGITPDYLSMRFRKETKESLLHYMKRVRVEEACRLLHCSDEPLVRISYRLGFSSQSQFTRQFREIMGTTPSAYRKSASLTPSDMEASNED